LSPLKSAAASIIVQKLVERHMERRSPPGQKFLRILALTLVLTSFVLLMIAGYRWLALHFDPIQAPALAAAIVLVTSCALWLIAGSLVPPRASPVQDVEQKVIQTAKDIFADLEGDLGQSVKEHPRAAMSVAALVGFLLARRLL
jgi:hypothetical protein